MDQMPVTVAAGFAAVALLTGWLFFMVVRKSYLVLIAVSIWMAIQAWLSISGVYADTEAMPPRFVFLAGPPMAFILGMFVSRKGRAFIDTLSLRRMMLVHVVRIPVEIVLYALYLYKLVPELMTFTGWNLDVLSGISALFLYLIMAGGYKLNRRLLLAWNFAGLALLINIVVIAVLSAPYSFQRFGVSQPNRAVLYFPFSWLPCMIVPIVLFCHLAAIRQLILPGIKRNAGTYAE